jgi:hypothetical protein
MTALCWAGMIRSPSAARMSVSQLASAGNAASRSCVFSVSTKSTSASTALALIIMCTKSTSHRDTARSP